MKKFILLCILIFASLSLYAQSADVITDILEAEKMTYGQAAYLSAISQNLISENDSLDDAVNALIKNGQIPENTIGGNEINLQDLSGIFTKMFGVSGGLFYRLTKGSPRYAFKHLKSEGLLSATADPAQIPSGSDALSLFTKCNMRYGQAQFTDEL